MKVWWITDKNGTMLALMTRVYNVPKILTLMYESRCEFELQDDTATLITYRVKDPKYPKWSDFVTVRGVEVPVIGASTVWWVTGERGKFLGLVPKDVSVQDYLSAVFREDEVHIVLDHEEDDLLVYEIRWMDEDPARVVMVRAEKMTFKL